MNKKPNEIHENLNHTKNDYIIQARPEHSPGLQILLPYHQQHSNLPNKTHIVHGVLNQCTFLSRPR